MRIPLTIISGYLGAGKTTLLKHILDKTNEKIAVIMNEFGDLQIDGTIVKGQAVDIVELQGGCVCCSLTEELQEGIKEILEKVKPDRIVLETTGVAEPDALIVEIDKLKGVQLDSVVIVADADALIKFPKIGQTAIIQFEMADIILVNKTDLVSEEQLTQIQTKLIELNPHAPLLKTKQSEVDLDVLFGLYKEKDIKPKQAHNHIEQFGFESEKTIPLEKVQALYDDLPPEIYRSKGFVKTDKGSYLINYVAKRFTIEPMFATKNQLVFIGEDVHKHKEEIEQKLA